MRLWQLTERKVDGKLLCPEVCCGAPVMECSCGPECKHCNCHEIQRLAKKVDETATSGATSSANIATVASPQVAYSKKSAKKQKPGANALDMKGISLFGQPIKR